MPLYAHIKTDRIDSWFRILNKTTKPTKTSKLKTSPSCTILKIGK